ncbi:MAG: VWA domain-containing protein, partial [Chloroflexi bacterium]|nr:VWA domain-containing protein [Chloroflexota bacterium]
ASIEGVALGPATALPSGEAPPPVGSTVIAIETSSSMIAGQLERAQAAALGFLDGLPAQDRVAVVSFGDDVAVVSGLTTDRAASRAAIEGLALGTFAGIYSGVGTAADLLAPEPAPKAILVLGFGWDFGGVGDFSRASSTEAALASGAAFYWASVSTSFDRAYFAQIAGGSGGRLLALDEVPALASELGPAAAEVQTFRFASPVLAAGARSLTIVAGQAELAAALVVDNAGLLSISTLEGAAAGDPIQLQLESLVPLAGLDIVATAAGQSLSLNAASGRIALDPWAFAPGSSNADIVVQGVGGVALTVGATVEIPALVPQLTIAEVTDAAEPSVAIAWRTQGAEIARLLVTVDGAPAADTTEHGVTVVVREGAIVVASLVDARGAELASTTLDVAAAAAGGAAGGLSTQLLGVVAVAVTGAIAIFFFARLVRRPGRPPEFRAEALFAGFASPVAWLRSRVSRSDKADEPRYGSGPVAQVLVRTSDGAELRVAVRDSQLSVGASQQCDVTLSGAEVRFVHMILTHVGENAYRVFRFGPVAREQGEAEISDDEVIAAGEWMRVGGYSVSVEASHGAASAA